MNRRSRIPVPGARLPDANASGSWKFKRRESHYHQGLDIGGLYGGDHPLFPNNEEYQRARKSGKLAIVSVVSGTVWEISGQVTDTTSYGLKIVIKSDDPLPIAGEDTHLWFLHAHCAAVDERLRKGSHVEAGQEIAFVGHSGNAGADNPHLHFEVATKPLPTGPGPAHETTPTVKRRRIDPYMVLEMLGPFPAAQAYIINSTEVTAEALLDHHARVERSSAGGFFPLGANNIWHGGVHLPMPAGSKLVAPFDGEIVAVRLDPTLHSDRQAFGSTNFVLMRHELPSRLYEALRGGKELAEAPVGDEPDAPAESVAALDEDDEDAVECCGDGERFAGLVVETDEGLEGLEAFEGDEGDEDDEDDPAPAPADDPEPPPPQHPERVVYSLLMHVAAQPLTDELAKKVPWLTRVRVGPGPDGPPPGAQEAEAANRKHAKDLAEAHSHVVRKTVGDGKGPKADVTWVQRRLFQLDFLPEGSITGTPDAALTSAIEAFQAAHVFGEGSKKIDGLVKPNLKTFRALRKTRRELGLDPTPPGPQTISPMFVGRASERKDDVAKVISGLNVRVSAGEALWHSGQASGFGDKGTATLLDQVHWEIFSEHPIFIDGVDGWDSIRDDDDNLTADAPQSLLDLIDKDTFTFAPPFLVAADGIVSLSELKDFYRGPDSTFLRRRQCFFRTEWGLDLDATRAALVKTFENAATFPTTVAPYQWWTQAGDRLPPFASDDAITHVWHYNPIEFVGEYQKALQAIAPPPKKDPREFADLQVTVINKQGGRLGHVKVTLRQADGTTRQATTKNPAASGRDGGVVTFFDVPKGFVHIDAHYKRKKQEWKVAFIPVPIATANAKNDSFVLNELELEASVDGDGPPRGAIRVNVRRFGAIHKPPVEVQLLDSTGIVKAAETSGSKVVFDDLPFGTYQVRCTDGQSDTKTVVVDRKQPLSRTLDRLLPPAKLLVRVLHGGTPVEGVLASAETTAKNKPPVTRSAVTDLHGESLLDVYQGPYVVAVHAPKSTPKAVNAIAGKTKLVTITLKNPPPQVETGVLLVGVDVGPSSPHDQVLLCTKAHPDFTVQTAAVEGGVATFISPPGDYVVRFRDLEADVTIVAGTEVTQPLPPHP